MVDTLSRKPTYGTLSHMKTFLAKKGTVQPKWHLVDADGVVLGRLAVKVANLLRGRHRPTYTPHVDTGDFVVVINAAKVALTGKKEEQNRYMSFSGYVGGEIRRTVPEMRARRPAFIIQHAVKGMLPKNYLAARMITKLKIFAGPTHTHEAQNPVKISV
jgi:large subunit ribosomal protein L13